MNRVFKTKWSVAHQEYIVTDEKHTTKGKAAKSAVALAVVAMMLGAGTASAAYQEVGFLATSITPLQHAAKSWETAEYHKDWGLSAMNASSAYALGYHGQGVAVGVMDSGALLQIHPELAGDRFHAAHNKGSYGSSGNRYPQGALPQFNGKYEAGQDYGDVTGDWKLNVNDSHGTHVTGTVGANRDGNEFHGVAWGSNVHVGNTGGTDDSNYGPFLDYQFFMNGWSQLTKDLIAANGAKRGGVINNSFGTNTRVDADRKSQKGNDGGYIGNMMEVNTVSDTEYEYFMFKQMYGDGHKNFVDAAYDAVKNTNVVQTITTGNRDMVHPYYRALYPYFNPEAEKHWIAVAGLQKSKDGTKYELIKTFNEAGNAKWWTVVGPGDGIYSSAVVEGSYVEPGVGEGAGKNLGDPTYAAWGGTSMAAPHVTGAMAVLMSRYKDMSAIQVRDVMFTTARHTNADGSDFEGWKNLDGTTPGKGEVSDRMGWGLPDLNKGMFGPGQLLGEFDYDMSTTKLDVWSNDISEEALNQREREDKAWLAAAQKWIDNGQPLTLGDNFTAEEKKLIGDILLDTPDDLVGIDADKEKVTEADAKKWRKEYFDKRIQAIKDRKYDGSLIKNGTGTLVMTGNNTYEGTTTVKGGTLLAFAESIGKDDKVTVEGGAFGVLSSYDDQFTMKGHIDSKEATAGKLTINVKNGGTLYVDAASNVVIKDVTFEGQKKVEVGLAGADRQGLIDTFNGKKDAMSGSFEAKESGKVFDGVKPTELDVNSAFFELGNVTAEGNKITTTMIKKDGVTFATFAKGANQSSIANAIQASNNALMGELLSKDKATIEAAYAGLDDDFYVTARNALVQNATFVTRAVRDQAQGMGEGRAAELDQGRARIWATGMGLWGTADGNSQSLDNDFTVGMIGGEVNVCPATKLGAFFGYGSTKLDGVQGNIKADDKHYGIYGLTDIGSFSVTYGLAYTDQSRDTVRNLMGTPTAHSEDASVLQGFAEAGYNFEIAATKVTPYVGLTWARVETDAATDHAMKDSFKTDEIKDDIQIATLGVRTALPFNWGTLPVAVKADAGWSHFFGDNDGSVSVQMGKDGQFATIEGSELKDQFNLGLGIVGQVGKHATVGVSYTGAWGSDIDSHGIVGNLRINF